MSVVLRKEPSNLKNINFNFKDNSDFGMINLCCWQKDLQNIEHPNKIVLNNEKVQIYYPMFDHYYTKTYTNQSGFTLKQLVDRIVKVGNQAGKYHAKHHPQDYTGEPDPSAMTGEYAITWSPQGSDLKYKGSKVFVTLQH